MIIDFEYDWVVAKRDENSKSNNAENGNPFDTLELFSKLALERIDDNNQNILKCDEQKNHKDE